MKPGRELDALISKNIFGAYIPENADLQYLETCLALPHYSTDIAAAWSVVENMRHKGYRTEIVFGTQADAYVTFVIGVVRYRADTASVSNSICLAALKCMGIETPRHEAQKEEK